MAYDIFSQPQGPNIDVSLFPRVSEAGLAAGRAQGTLLSNAIEGALEGYKTGTAIRGAELANRAASIELETLPQRKAEELKQEQLETTLKQNQVDRLDTTNKIQDLQLRVNQLKVQEAERLQELSLTTQEAALREEAAKSQFNTERLDRKKSFLDAFQKATPRGQIDLVQAFPDVLLDEDLQKTLFNSLRLNPVTPDVLRERLDIIDGRKAAQTRAQKEAEDARFAYPKALADYNATDLADKIAEKLPSVPKEYQGKETVLVPSNQYELNGSQLVLKNGKPVEIAGWATEPVTSYMVLNKDRTQLIAQGVSKDDYKASKNLESAQNLMDSTAALTAANYAEENIKKIYADKRSAQQAAQTQPQQPAVEQPKKSSLLTGVSSKVDILIQAQKNPERFKNLVLNIKKDLDQLNTSGVDRASLESSVQKKIADSVNQLLLKEYQEEDESVKDEYQEKSRIYNENMTAQAGPLTLSRTLEPYLMNGGKDMYVKTKAEELKDPLGQILDELYKSTQTAQTQSLSAAKGYFSSGL